MNIFLVDTLEEEEAPCLVDKSNISTGCPKKNASMFKTAITPSKMALGIKLRWVLNTYCWWALKFLNSDHWGPRKWSLKFLTWCLKHDQTNFMTKSTFWTFRGCWQPQFASEVNHFYWIIQSLPLALHNGMTLGIWLKMWAPESSESSIKINENLTSIKMKTFDSCRSPLRNFWTPLTRSCR